MEIKNNQNEIDYYKEFMNMSTKYMLVFCIGVVIELGFRWKIAKPHQFLVKTGAFTRNKIIIGRSLIRYPFQHIETINLSPHTYQFTLHNKSKDNVGFNLPVAFTIGPVSPEENKGLFIKYCNKMTELSVEETENTIKEMIEGKTRNITANMTIQEMFTTNENFRDQVINKISADFEEFGLKIYNANIKEISDNDEQNNVINKLDEDINYDRR